MDITIINSMPNTSLMITSCTLHGIKSDKSGVDTISVLKNSRMKVFPEDMAILPSVKCAKQTINKWDTLILPWEDDGAYLTFDCLIWHNEERYFSGTVFIPIEGTIKHDCSLLLEIKEGCPWFKIDTVPVPIFDSSGMGTDFEDWKEGGLVEVEPCFID